MKSDIHPEYVECEVVCTCGNKFTTRSVKANISTDICGTCHPFFTGNDRIVDATGRVERFQKRFNWDQKKEEAKA